MQPAVLEKRSRRRGDPAAGTFYLAQVKYFVVLRTKQNTKQAWKPRTVVGVAISSHKMSPLSTRLNASDSSISPLGVLFLFSLGVGWGAGDKVMAKFYQNKQYMFEVEC